MMIVTYVDSENNGDHDGSTDIGDNYQRGKAGTMVFVIVTYDDMIMLLAIGNNGYDHGALLTMISVTITSVASPECNIWRYDDVDDSNWQ